MDTSVALKRFHERLSSHLGRQDSSSKANNSDEELDYISDSSSSSSKSTIHVTPQGEAEGEKAVLALQSVHDSADDEELEQHMLSSRHHHPSGETGDYSVLA